MAKRYDPGNLNLSYEKENKYMATYSYFVILIQTYHGKQFLKKAHNEGHVYVQEAYKIIGMVHLVMVSSFVLYCS